MDTFKEILFVAERLRAIPLIGRKERNRDNKTDEFQTKAALFEIHAGRNRDDPPAEGNLLKKSITVRVKPEPEPEPIGREFGEQQKRKSARDDEERLVSRLIEVRQRQVPVVAALQRAGQQQSIQAGRRRVQNMPVARDAQPEAWRLFARSDGRLSVFEIVALLANLLLLSAILVVIFKLCRKSRSRPGSKQLVVPVTVASGGGPKQLPSRENLSPGVMSASPSLQSSLNLTPTPSTMPTPSPLSEINSQQSSVGNEPKEAALSTVGSAREINKEFSAAGSQPNKATAIVQPSKEENSGNGDFTIELKHSKPSPDRKRRSVTTESIGEHGRASRRVSTGSLGSSQEASKQKSRQVLTAKELKSQTSNNNNTTSSDAPATINKRLSGASSEPEATNKQTGSTDKTGSVAIDIGQLESVEKRSEKPVSKEEDKIASWISIDQREKVPKQMVKSVISDVPVRIPEASADIKPDTSVVVVVDTTDRKRDPPVDKVPITELADQNEDGCSETGLDLERVVENQSKSPVALFPQSTDRKYFVYIVNDTHFTPKKECIARIELPQSKKNISLSELRQMITNSRDVGLSSIKRSKFKFVTETYRLLNENEDATLLNSIYPTQGVFLKLNATDQLLVENYSSHNNRMRTTSVNSLERSRQVLSKKRSSGEASGLIEDFEKETKTTPIIEQRYRGGRVDTSGPRPGVIPAKPLGMYRKTGHRSRPQISG